MFGKLRDKLKKSLSLFSKKAEEEAEPVDTPTEEPPEPTTEPEPTPEPIPEPEQPPQSADDLLKEVEEEAKEPEPVEKQAPEPTPEPVKEESIAEPTPEPIKEEIPEEQLKKSFFKKIFTKKEEPVKEEVEPTPEIVVEESTSAPEPTPEQTSERVEEETEPIKKVEEKTGIFSKAKQFVTTKKLSEKKFDELFWELELALLESNVAVEVIHKMKEDLKKELLDKPLPRNLEQVVEQTLKSSINSIITPPEQNIIEKVKQKAKEKKPYTIAFFGINGSGKTTTIAKLAQQLKDNNLTCVMAAGDTFRAAAIHQLEEHANNLDIRIIKHDYGSDAAAVAFDAVKYAKNNDIDVVLIDTAGRLHSDTNLMDELKKIVKVATPDLKLFVGESITGNDCIEQAEKFNEHIGIDGIILTKADVDEKGGTALSISYVIKKPILYIGMGQSYTDLKPFTKELVMENLGLA